MERGESLLLLGSALDLEWVPALIYFPDDIRFGYRSTI